MNTIDQLREAIKINSESAHPIYGLNALLERAVARISHLESLIDWFPPHKCGLFLTHNEHKDYYETVAQQVEDGSIKNYHWVSEEEKQKAIDTDELWGLQWYPETPIGSHTLVASSLDAIRAALKSVDQREEGRC